MNGQKGGWKNLQFQVLNTLFSTSDFESSAWGWGLGLGKGKGGEDKKIDI